MLDQTQPDLAAIATRWLADFEAAGDLTALFTADCWWRDLLAGTWEIQTTQGRTDVTAALSTLPAKHRFAGLKIAEGRWPPSMVARAGRDCLEVFVAFETEIGRGTAVLRLVDDGGTWKAWTLMTALDEIKGHEEQTGQDRPKGQAYSRDFRGPNWKDLRDKALAYEDHDPAVIVVGGGQAGLAIAARLTQLGVDTLIVDREKRIGDNWRLRYHALTLHNQVQVNHLPYMPFPPSWPTYIPKDKLANWFEAYVDAMELNFWTDTSFDGGTYDDATGQWEVQLTHKGQPRTMRPRHVVMATGVSGIPSLPEIPGIDAYKGPVLHSSQYTDGDDWTGKSAIVFGTGNSAHDISQDLVSAGAKVTMVQRSPTLVVNVEPSAQLPYILYESGPSTDDCDLISQASPVPLVREMHKDYTRQSEELDKPLLDGLKAKGMRLHNGIDGTGWQFLYLTRGGGYYFNVGASQMIADGRIEIVQADDIAGFTETGATLTNGEERPADLMVLSTGYKGQEYLVGKLFGEDVAEKVGPIWGFDKADGETELRNMYCRTGQPGLWFIAGSLAQCRIFSKYLGLQIKAAEEGLLAG
ncbi:MAG: NAD(P)/FAD-dependent oxidoreductase [Pseudomonadota bacterium]